MRTDIDIATYKEKLLVEKAALEAELSEIGQKNEQNPDDWEATSPDVNRGETDPIDRADNIEELENNTAIVGNLETRLEHVNNALERIDAGTYGYCIVSNEPIETDRLDANPAAETCKAHMED
ncbi:MAG: hypothetical protein COV34_03630 [Candidatus Zambryskibacteria bacterium CG10_big_fil_rev_8_21_14_0_10_42_12]|uniref:Uncharacterized protein n=1 Tax=Candidatus Zambryskibacteria bacterium CG10_big_fil_rev_8_21_14_0_10_42_12 TaxID=1975115 RepID=A0A2H0QUQ2_9BACT|nr:MAG: hypothetical protein COV34_03630 [Candidatus Zambryskibacteria bacterium CG10_big_fil_rev_8_21_14_0_10_42_12]